MSETTKEVQLKRDIKMLSGIDSPTLIRLPVVKVRTGLPTSSLYKLMAEGKFPRPIPLYGRTVAWVEAEVIDWINERIAEAEEVS